MEFLSFRALCVTTAFLEKQIKTFSPIQILTFRRSYFALGSPVLHEITVEDVRSDCFNSSPMKGSKVSWNGKSYEWSVPEGFFFCQGFAARGFGLRPAPKRHARDKNVCSQERMIILSCCSRVYFKWTKINTKELYWRYLVIVEQAGYAENIKDKNNSAAVNVGNSLTVRIPFVFCLQIMTK